MFRPDHIPPDRADNELHIIFQRGELLSDMRAGELCLIDRQQLEGHGWRVQQRQFLGYWRDCPCYALEIDEIEDVDPLQYQRGNLYHILGRDISERAMRCEPCGTVNFPRIAPCVIVLVTRGEELLLARNVNFPGPMYSTLAGFIEAGETAEETLAREVREEVGVEIRGIQYFQSQSWPFPNQLMLGFFAEYAGGDIVCDEIEIADAGWFHYRELPMIPPPSSVAGQLIRHYVSRFG